MHLPAGVCQVWLHVVNNDVKPHSQGESTNETGATNLMQQLLFVDTTGNVSTSLFPHVTPSQYRAEAVALGILESRRS